MTGGSPHKELITRKEFPCHDVIISLRFPMSVSRYRCVVHQYITMICIRCSRRTKRRISDINANIVHMFARDEWNTLNLPQKLFTLRSIFMPYCMIAVIASRTAGCCKHCLVGVSLFLISTSCLTNRNYRWVETPWLSCDVTVMYPSHRFAATLICCSNKGNWTTLQLGVYWALVWDMFSTLRPGWGYIANSLSSIIFPFFRIIKTHLTCWIYLLDVDAVKLSRSWSAVVPIKYECD